MTSLPGAQGNEEVWSLSHQAGIKMRITGVPYLELSSLIIFLQSGVNMVKWDPSGTLLASCSDDHTAKVWTMKQDSWLHDLCMHSGDIYTLQWSKTGPGSAHPSVSPILAT
jgi:WD40 repeat protein